MIELRYLKPQARSLITSETYREISPVALGEYITDFKSYDGRKINLEPLFDVVQTGMQKFIDEQPEKSDAWLAPRIHAALRLYRSEAAEMGIWEYLTVCTQPIRAYIIWRWGKSETGAGVKLFHIFGEARRNALGRLWWSAELTRNGSDYSPTVDLFAYQDAVNYVTDVLAYENRAAAVAYTRVIRRYIDSGGQKVKEKAVKVGKGLNNLLVTVVLGSVVPDQASDLYAYECWLKEEPDATLIIKNLPAGPNEQKVDEKKIAAVIELMDLIK